MLRAAIQTRSLSAIRSVASVSNCDALELLFDAGWYLDRNIDVRASRMDPLAHFLRSGWKEGRDPHPLFSVNWYLEKNPDLRAAGMNPLVHFLTAGAVEGRSPHPLFDVGWYLLQNSDVHPGQINPLVHFVAFGAREGRDPNPLFDVGWYVSQNPDVLVSGVNPLAHFINSGAAEGRDPNPLFHTRWYSKHNLEPGAPASDALAHYLFIGATEGRDPNPLFDTDWYLSENADVRASGINPLTHYLKFGAQEGRDPNPLFDTDWYLTQNPDVGASGVNPLAHFLRTGATEGRNPNPLFNVDWYIERNPEVTALGMNPLAHYIQFGPGSNIDPSPAFDTEWYVAKNGRAWKADETALGHFLSSKLPLALIEKKPKVLIIEAAYPRPDRDSGSIDAINFVKMFLKFGYQVLFVAEDEFDSDSPYRFQLQSLGVIVIDAQTAASVRQFIRQAAPFLDLCFLSRVYAGGRYLEDIRRCGAAKIIFNTVDLLHIRELRQAALENNRAVQDQAMETRKREAYLTCQADLTIVVSSSEAKLLKSLTPAARIVHVPLIRDIPGRQNSFRDRQGLAFVGNYLHPPNLDAVMHFLGSVWPLILRSRPGTRFFALGPCMPKELADRNDAGFEPVGYVEDLRPWLERVIITVAPLRYGAGAKGKVISSLAHGVPCVASPVAVEGMDLTPDKDILVGSNPSEFASHVVRLLADSELWKRVSLSGLETVQQAHSLQAGETRMLNILQTINAPLPVSLSGTHPVLAS